MTEWRLWEGDEPPTFTRHNFFVAHPRIPGEHQIGHSERIAMVVKAINELMLYRQWWAVSDVGCGDGSFLTQLIGHPRVLTSWGYDAGRGNVAHAVAQGSVVTQADITQDELSYGDITTITEVLEHLVDPGEMLRRIQSQYLIATSPSAETDEWHYEHHAWAWDKQGYIDLIARNGWVVLNHYECEAQHEVTFGPVVETKRPRFQCVVAERL